MRLFWHRRYSVGTVEVSRYVVIKDYTEADEESRDVVLDSWTGQVVFSSPDQAVLESTAEELDALSRRRGNGYATTFAVFDSAEGHHVFAHGDKKICRARARHLNRVA